MIKINLLGEDTAIDNSSNLLIAGYVASLLVCVGVFYFLNDSIAFEVAQKTTESGKLERQLAALQETTKEVKELDRKRAELNDKLVVIATLKRNKVGPVKAMDDLNLSLPERAWITDIRETGSILRITGYALDNQTIATFMKDLQTSDYFTTVDLVETKQVEERGVKVKDFTLDAKISYTGKLRAKKPEESQVNTKS